MPLKWTPYFLISIGAVNLLFINRSPNLVILGLVFVAWGVGLLLYQYVRPKPAPPAVRSTIVTTIAPKATSHDRGGRAISSVSEELAKLSILRDKGVLTDAEFEAQKRKLLE